MYWVTKFVLTKFALVELALVWIAYTQEINYTRKCKSIWYLSQYQYLWNLHSLNSSTSSHCLLLLSVDFYFWLVVWGCFSECLFSNQTCYIFLFEHFFFSFLVSQKINANNILLFESQKSERRNILIFKIEIF